MQGIPRKRTIFANEMQIMLQDYGNIKDDIAKGEMPERAA